MKQKTKSIYLFFLLLAIMSLDVKTKACRRCFRVGSSSSPSLPIQSHAGTNRAVFRQSPRKCVEVPQTVPTVYRMTTGVSPSVAYTRVLQESSRVFHSDPFSPSEAEDSVNDDNKNQDNDDQGKSELELEETLKSLMLSWIRWYRETLSPIMPPNCRFFPSCSKYAIQAIEEFGPLKGGILTAWRLLRCNPSGGSGYDPPQWPPPNYFRKNYNPPMS